MPIMLAFSQFMGFSIEPVLLVVVMASRFMLLTFAANTPTAFIYHIWLCMGKYYFLNKDYYMDCTMYKVCIKLFLIVNV